MRSLLKRFGRIWPVGARSGIKSDGPTANPFDTQANGAELTRLLRHFQAGRCDLRRSTALDLAMAYRLLLGRWPTPSEMNRYLAAPPRGGVDGLLRQVLSSPEFPNRRIAVEFERPEHDCIVMIETPDGLRFFFSVQDTFVGFPIAVGVFEPDVQAAIGLLVRPGMNCLDVGANLGYYSVRFGAVVGPEGGRVFSFEPDDFAFGLLKKNCQENGLQDVISLFHVACGHEDGEAVLYRDENPANYGGMTLRAPSPAAAGVPVPVRRLDSLIPPGTRIDFAKIDVEGYERLVVQGMRRVIGESSPVLLCEFNTPALASAAPEEPARFLDELSDLGYNVYEAAAFGRFVAAPFKYSKRQVQFANLVCLPGGQAPERWFPQNQASGDDPQGSAPFCKGE